MHLPVISISEIANVNKSAGTFTFTLTSDSPAIAGYPIEITNLSVDDTNTTGPQYYGTHHPDPVTITSSSTNNAEDVAVTLTANNSVYQGWGEISVSLVNGEDYKANTGTNSREVTIIDDQVAPVSVAISARGSAVEGTMFDVTFTATGTFPVGESITFEPTITETGTPSVYYGGHSPRSLTLSTDNTSDTITITASENPDKEENGEITVSIERGDGYEVHNTDYTKSIVLLDNETLPIVSIAAVGTSIDEGQDAEFQLSVMNTLESPLDIEVSVDDGAGDFLTETHTKKTETIPVSGSRRLQYSTIADIIEESNGTITVSIIEDESDIINYLVAPNNAGTATLTVIDNDDPNLPTITISAVDSSIVEGEPLIFTLESAQMFTPPLSVSVEIIETNSGTGDFLGDVSDPNRFTLPDRIEIQEITRTTNIILPTTHDATTETTGTITARVKSDDSPTTTYSVGVAHTASISVADDDIAGFPSLTIALKDPAQSNITEGDPDPVFTITSTGGTTGNSLDVDVRITERGNFLQTANEVKTRQFTIGTPHDFTVATVNDDIDEPDGRIFATLQLKDPQEYSIGVDYQAIVNIADDEATPEFTITAATPTIVEGTDTDPTNYNTLIFDVTLNRQSMQDITVEFGFGDSGDTATEDVDYTHSYDTIEKRKFTFSGARPGIAGETSKTIEVKIVADALNEPTETFSVDLLNPTNAIFAGNDLEITETAEILNDDAVPSISLDSPTAKNTEGSDIEFPISLSAPSGQRY